jgi:hypothetical protein
MDDNTFASSIWNFQEIVHGYLIALIDNLGTACARYARSAPVSDFILLFPV